MSMYWNKNEYVYWSDSVSEPFFDNEYGFFYRTHSCGGTRLKNEEYRFDGGTGNQKCPIKFLNKDQLIQMINWHQNQINLAKSELDGRKTN